MLQQVANSKFLTFSTASICSFVHTKIDDDHSSTIHHGEGPKEATDETSKTDMIDRRSASKTSFTACEGSNKHILGGIEK